MAAEQKFSDDLIIRTGKDIERERHGRVTPTAIQVRMGGGNRLRIEKVWMAHLAGRPVPPGQAAEESALMPDGDAAALVDDFTAQSTTAIRRLAEAAFRIGYARGEAAAAKHKAAIEAEMQVAAVELQELEAALRHQEAATEAAQHASDAGQRKAADARTALTALQAEFAVAREQIRSLTDAAAEQRTLRDASEMRAASATSRLEAAQEKIMDLRQGLATAEAALAETERRAQTLDARCATLDEALTKLRSGKAEADAELASLRTRHAALEAQFRTAEERHLAAESRAADLRSEIARLSRDDATSSARAAALHERGEALARELAELRGALDQERERRIRLEAATSGRQPVREEVLPPTTPA